MVGDGVERATVAATKAAFWFVMLGEGDGLMEIPRASCGYGNLLL